MPKYRPINIQPIVAIRLNMDFAGSRLNYIKWGGVQTAKPGDWLVMRPDDTQDVYTIDAESFRLTYAPVPGAMGQYIKIATVEAEQARYAGSVQTKEGVSSYQAGDYVVSNGPGDAYAVSRHVFEAKYELVA